MHFLYFAFILFLVTYARISNAKALSRNVKIAGKRFKDYLSSASKTKLYCLNNFIQTHIYQSVRRLNVVKFWSHIVRISNCISISNIRSTLHKILKLFYLFPHENGTRDRIISILFILSICI